MTTTTDHVIHCENGPETVTAAEPAPGLLVYQVPPTVSVGDPYRWSVGTRSGLLIAQFRTEQAAARTAEDLAELADWAATTSELRDLALKHKATSRRFRELMHDAITTHGGLFGSTPAPDSGRTTT